MDRHVLVPLLEPVVFLDVVKIVTSDDHGVLHLHLGDHSGEDTTTDGDLDKVNDDQQMMYNTASTNHKLFYHCINHQVYCIMKPCLRFQ